MQSLRPSLRPAEAFYWCPQMNHIPIRSSLRVSDSVTLSQMHKNLLPRVVPGRRQGDVPAVFSKHFRWSPSTMQPGKQKVRSVNGKSHSETLSGHPVWFLMRDLNVGFSEGRAKVLMVSCWMKTLKYSVTHHNVVTRRKQMTNLWRTKSYSKEVALFITHSLLLYKHIKTLNGQTRLNPI